MRLLFTWCLVFFFGWLGFRSNKSPSLDAPPGPKIFRDTINFSNQIKPILVKNCSPCHFPGGKMYERMPFDQDTTIVNHQAGILRRIKGDDNTLIKTFVQQYKHDN